MSGYLLDTNVVSELARQSPHPAVVRFLDQRDDFWLSAIVLGELTLGVQLLPHGRRRDNLSDWLSQLLVDFDQRVLPIKRGEAERAAAFRARAHRDGRVLQLADALIAGTAATNDLVIVTRNVRDFVGFDVIVFNPWEFS